MLYRKYRPNKFSEIIGSTQVASTISNALYKDEIAHAFFLYGSRGIGKTTTARLLAKALNCQTPIIDPKSKIPFEPCGECASCKAVESGRHLDLIEIDAASNRGIDSIRELIDKVKLSPAMGKNKVYIIDEVHMLTNEASNALLKTLEEPPEHAYFILCTTNPEKVLDTIKSRCQQFVLKRPTLDEIQEKINLILEKENKKVPENLISKIASGAKGAFRDAETLLEQVLSKIEGEDEFSFGSSYNDYAQLLLNLNSKNTTESLNVVSKALENEPNAEVWVEGYIEFLRSLMLYKFGIKNALNLYESTYKEYEKELNAISTASLQQIISQFSKAMEDFRYVAIPSLPIEMAIVRVTDGEAIPSGNAGPSSGGAGAGAGTKPTNKSTPLTMPSAPSAASASPVQASQPSVTAASSSASALNNEAVVEVIVMEAPLPEPEPQPVVTVEVKEKSFKYPREFPFKKMVAQLKETNHSIYLLLGTAIVDRFTDDGILILKVPYSFHKERLMSSKMRGTIEDSATALIGSKVVLDCDLISESREATELTDNNIALPKKDVPLERVFEDVFGDDIV
jgi:DNA polymerase-3 subunit gamma/tau